MVVYKYRGLGGCNCARSALGDSSDDAAIMTGTATAANGAMTTKSLIAAGTTTGVIVWGITKILDGIFNK